MAFVLDKAGRPLVSRGKNGPNRNWKNDAIQFARLLDALQAAGYFGPPESDNGAAVLGRLEAALLDSMDLDRAQVAELLDRANAVWEDVKSRT